jgi:hypothetical protein
MRLTRLLAYWNLRTYIKSATTFTNNPFHYSHTEEQFVNNPKDKIIIDYGIKLPKDFIQWY